MTWPRPLYEVIESCTDPEALWGKLDSENWDWLGVKPDGTFVVGRPARHSPTIRISGGRSGPPDVPQDQHVVKVTAPPHGSSPFEYWAATPEEAGRIFDREVVVDKERGPFIKRVRRFEKGDLIDERRYVPSGGGVWWVGGWGPPRGGAIGVILGV